jgi:hypothetical protein
VAHQTCLLKKKKSLSSVKGAYSQKTIFFLTSIGLVPIQNLKLLMDKERPLIWKNFSTNPVGKGHRMESSGSLAVGWPKVRAQPTKGQAQRVPWKKLWGLLTHIVQLFAQGSETLPCTPCGKYLENTATFLEGFVKFVLKKVAGATAAEQARP